MYVKFFPVNSTLFLLADPGFDFEAYFLQRNGLVVTLYVVWFTVTSLDIEFHLPTSETFQNPKGQEYAIDESQGHQTFVERIPHIWPIQNVKGQTVGHDSNKGQNRLCNSVQPKTHFGNHLVFEWCILGT